MTLQTVMQNNTSANMTPMEQTYEEMSYKAYNKPGGRAFLQNFMKLIKKKQGRCPTKKEGNVPTMAVDLESCKPGCSPSVASSEPAHTVRKSTKARWKAGCWAFLRVFVRLFKRKKRPSYQPAASVGIPVTKECQDGKAEETPVKAGQEEQRVALIPYHSTNEGQPATLLLMVKEESPDKVPVGFPYVHTWEMITSYEDTENGADYGHILGAEEVVHNW